jgi:hypothetical protein
MRISRGLYRSASPSSVDMPGAAMERRSMDLQVVYYPSFEWVVWNILLASRLLRDWCSTHSQKMVLPQSILRKNAARGAIACAISRLAADVPEYRSSPKTDPVLGRSVFARGARWCLFRLRCLHCLSYRRPNRTLGGRRAAVPGRLCIGCGSETEYVPCLGTQPPLNEDM